MATDTAMQEDLEKLATLGQGTDADFESSFASIAFSYIRKRVPKLIEHCKGFQLLDRNEESTKAAGVFGSQINGQWFYLPIFFLNRELKGYELLFTRRVFVPNQEGWVNYFLGQSDAQIGRGRRQGQMTQFRGTPDLRGMTSPYGLSKTSSDNFQLLSYLGASAASRELDAGFFSREKAGSALSLEKIAASPYGFAMSDSTLSLPTYLSKNLSAAVAIEKLAEHRPKIGRYLRKRFGGDCFEAWKQAAQRVDVPRSRSKFAHALYLDTLRDVSKSLRTSDQVDPIKSGALRVIERSMDTILASPGVDPEDMTPDVKSRLAVDGKVVDDERTDSQLSKILDESKVRLGNPTEPGGYKVLTEDGTKEFTLLRAHQDTSDRDIAGAWYVLDGAKLTTAAGERIWVDNTEERTPIRKAVKELSSTSLSEGTKFLCVDPDGDCYGPFEVKRKDGDTVEVEYFKPERHYHSVREALGSSPGVAQSVARSNYRQVWLHGRGAPYGTVGTDLEKDKGDRLIRLSIAPEENKGVRARMLGDTLRLPHDVKFVACGEVGPTLGDWEFGSLGKTIKTAAIATVEIEKNQDVYRIRLDGENLYSHGQKKASLAIMHWLAASGSDAAEMLKAADNRKTARFYVRLPAYREADRQAGRLKKVAFDLPQQPYAPAFPQDNITSEQAGQIQLPGRLNGVESLPVESFRGLSQNMPEDPYHRYRYEDMQPQVAGIEKSIDSQEEPLGTDVKILFSLLKTVGVDRDIREAVKASLKLTDRFGKVLYTLFWHYDDFEKLYGTGKMPALEDSVRNTFESAGEVALTLHERQVDQGEGESFDADLDEIANN